MLFDLSELDGDRTVCADVCLIGAGIAGLTLGARLCSAGLDVVILESGGRTQSVAEHPLNRVVNLGRPYHGATKGRARCLGGTSTMWGGALIPFLESDLCARPHLDLPTWPVAMEELRPHIRAVEALFNLDNNRYESDSCREADKGFAAEDADFVLRLAKWPSFKKRNVATLHKALIEDDPGLEVWLNATTTSFALDAERGRLFAAVATAPTTRKLKVVADHFVLCAGAIESTRLLLLLDRQTGERIRERSPTLGQYFHDHVSMIVARLDAGNVTKLNRMAAFRFRRGTMRSLRFEMSYRAQVEEAVASAFGHISFASDEPTGFDALRATLQTLQREGRIRLSDIQRLLRHMPYLARAGYWRLVHGQLLWPTPARYELHAVAEQVPAAGSRIGLADELDSLGNPLAEIDWRIHRRDAEAIAAFARRFDRFWSRRGLAEIADLNWVIDPYDISSIIADKVSDIYHPGGTTRMGAAPHIAVVDRDLNVFTVPNLSVASTSVFPAGASANPTMMLMAFCLRLGEHLAGRIKGGGRA